MVETGSPSDRSAPDFLQGGGEMGARMRAFAWQHHPLGDPHSWPNALRIPMALLLNSRQPMYLWWGPELVCFYNDAYRESIGAERHPGSLGQPGREVWAEIWDIIGPQIEQVVSRASGVSYENALVPITRNGRREDVYWSYTYSPIFDVAVGSGGGVAGVLVVCTETTRQVLAAMNESAERRRLAELFEQAPTFMAMLRGAQHRFELVNPAYLRLIGDRNPIGRTVAEVVPEAASAGYIELLDQVYRSGEPFTAIGRWIGFRGAPDGPLDERYMDFVYQPIRDAMGSVSGIFVVGTDVTERTVAEKALRESEARFRDIADSTPVLVWISDVSKTCVWFNSRWLDFTGRSMAQEIGYGWVSGIHPDDLGRCVEVYERAFDRREAYRTEYRRRRYDGEWRTLDASGVPRFIDGVFVGYIGSCIDVTDQQRADQALRASEEQLRLATEAAEIGLWDWDTETDTLYWPARVKAMFGHRPDAEVSIRDFYAGLHPDDREHTVAAFAAALDPKQRALYDVEYRTVGKVDGAVRWVAAKGRAVFRGDRCIRVLGTALDISPRKHAEARLRELNDRLEQRVAEALAERQVLVDIANTTDAFIQVLDADYRFLAINRAAADSLELAYGIRPSTGDCLLDLLEGHPDQRARVRQIWTRALAGEEFTEIDESGFLPFDQRHFEMKFNSLRDREGRLIGAFQFVYDVTDRLRDQARLAEAEKRLRQSQKMDAIGQLTGGVAHDFNNLLMVISGGLSLLDRRLEPERQQRIIGQMRQAADRGASLSRQLLAFARRQPLRAEPIDLHRKVDAMRELLNRTLRGDVQVKTELARDLAPIKVDSAELELVILNLCANARDAMPDGGTITISAANVPQDFVAFKVSDTGTGMSAEVLAHMFEPFFTTKELGKGSGLGLPQVYGFAQQSGGSVEVDSAPGRGTCVTLLLPRSDEKPERPAGEGAGSGDPWHQSSEAGSILLVEDNDEVAALVTEMLRELGYGVTRAATAQAALGALADDRVIDLMLSDILMPGSMSGVDLAREVRRRRPTLPVLLTTGFAGDPPKDVEAEHIDVLAKPYDLATLQAAIRDALLTPMRRATTPGGAPCA